jgi:hypothetical protein
MGNEPGTCLRKAIITTKNCWAMFSKELREIPDTFTTNMGMVRAMAAVEDKESVSFAEKHAP